MAAINAARPLTRDVAIIAPHLLETLVLIEQIKVALKVIERFDDAIARLAPTLPDFELFAALPGAGPTLAPRLLVAFGEQRERFVSAKELQQYSGVAPVTERSGKKSWVHCDGSARPLFARHLSSGQARPSTSRTGQAATIDNSVPREVPTKRLYEL